ncbi:MAG: enoyl-CoA hydratase/isomerase family protein [Candidatus Leucobacter sulfamidivorax]|nr:enoyl-CoA hydratase/isomerase family protein [Candidatus Leucobacter sulfamidivorax]
MPQSRPVRLHEEYESLIVHIEDHVATLTLNRPHRLNALSDGLLDEINRALDLLGKTRHRVVVIRGAGRAFCAGYDIAPDGSEIGYAAERTPVEDRDRLASNIELFTRLWRHPQPVIAAVHGYCIGGGSQLASFCDITVVAENAVIMSSPSLLIGGGYLSPMWVHLVGPKRAKLVSFDAGHRISGATAVEWGWATHAVPEEEFEQHIDELGRSIARTPGNVLRMKKEALNRVTELQGLLTYARMGAETDALLHQSQEVKEVQGWIRDMGLKAAIARFNEDGAPDFEV